MKDRPICWILFFLFILPVCFPVTSSCSFHVSMSLCLCVPEMTTSRTPWVRRLTARPAAATLERINVQEKTSARPLTPGSLRPTLPGWFALVGILNCNIKASPKQFPLRIYKRLIICIFTNLDVVHSVYWTVWISWVGKRRNSHWSPENSKEKMSQHMTIKI